MDADLDDSFGRWVKRRRKSLDLTQEALAIKVDCSTSTIEKIEADLRRPSRQIAGIMAQALEIPATELDDFVKIARRERVVDNLAGISPTTEQIERVNLPIPATPLVGRQVELYELGKLLSVPECRLLTLIGNGGIGKTRLALAASLNLQGIFKDGVYFVALVGVNDAELVAPLAAEVLNLNFFGPASPQIQLINYLKEKEILLLLDNYEQLLPGVDFIECLLNKASGLKLLVTSREPLGVPGEWLFDVQGLPVPSAAAKHIEDNSAVALFVQSARRSRADFRLETEDLPAVVSICDMVAGMPLGIELAAVWVRTLTCQEIAGEIKKNLSFLEISSRGVAERHRSLEAVFDHSWKLLSPQEKAALKRLSVFRGGFSRPAAEQVAGASLALLGNLASKSLIYRSELGRYHMHEVVRQFAFAKLIGDPQLFETSTSHSKYYLEMLRDNEGALRSHQQREAIVMLTGEIENIREAWRWAVEHKYPDLLGGALRSFGYLCNIIGWLQDGIDQVELVIEALPGPDPNEAERAVLGLAHEQQGILYFRQGNFARALEHFQEGVDILRQVDRPDLMSGSLIISGVITQLVGNYDRAIDLTREGFSCAQAAGDDWHRAYAVYNLGFVASLIGDYEAGYQQMLDGLEIWRRLGDPSSIALGLNFISPTAILLGRIDEAESFLQESKNLAVEVGDWWGTGTAYRNLGLAALAKGNLEQARLLLDKSLEIFSKVVIGWDIVRSLDYLARVEMASGNLSEARHIYFKALNTAMQEQTFPLALDILTGLAQLHAQAGEYEQVLAISLYALKDPRTVQETNDAARMLAAEAENHLDDNVIQNTRKLVARISLESIAEEILIAK